MITKKKFFHLNLYFIICVNSDLCFSGEYYYDLNLLNSVDYQIYGLKEKKLNATLNLDGVYNFNVQVNNKTLGNMSVEFKNATDKFYPILSDDLIKKISFNREVLKEIEKNKIKEMSALMNIFPEFSFKVSFEDNKLIFMIPNVYLRYYDETFPEEWDYGVNTLFSSYNLSGYDTNDKNGNNAKSKYLNLYSGINIGKWQLRNKSYYNEYNNKSDFYSDQTWLTRDIGEINSRLTVGQITTSGLLTQTFRFDGVKLESIPDMRPSFMNGYLPDIQGNALSNATVKIFQGNNLVYQTFVSPGIFNLSNIPITGNTDLRVQVIEENGNVHEDWVPVSSTNTLRRKNVLDYSVSMGRKSFGKKNVSESEIVSGEILYGLTSFGTLLSGGTFSNNYQSITFGGGLNLGNVGASSVLATNSSNQMYHKNGNVIEVRHFKQLTSTSTQINLSHQFFNGEYGAIDDELDSSSFRNKKTLTSLSVNQPTDLYGNFSLSFYLSRYAKKSDNKKNYSLNWSKYLYGAFYTLSSSRSEYLNKNYNNENVFSFNVSIPISSENRTYIPSNIAYNYTAGGDYTSNTISIDEALFNNKVKLKLANSRTTNAGEKQSINKLSTTYKSKSSDIYAGFTVSDNGYKQNSWRLAGTLITHSNGITASPYLVSERGATGIVSIPGASGVSLNSYNTSTDYFGNAMINNLRPYKKNKVSVSSRNLPSNIELQNVETSVIPANGAIIRTEFNAAVGNKAILNLLYEGKEIPFGSSAIEDPSSFANGNGTMYVTGLSDHQKIKVKLPDGKICSILFETSKAEKRNDIYFYEGVCD